MRVAGLGVAPALASEALHLRSAVILFYGCVALLLSVLWSRLARDAPVIAQLRGHVDRTLILCAIGPPLVLAANYAIVRGLISDVVALLPAALALAVAGLYSAVAHRLSGITGVGIAARLVLRSSYAWLSVAALAQFAWVAARVFGSHADLLWYLERPALEVAAIGFGLTAALGVLLTNLNTVYHSRNITQTLMRTCQAANGLIALWGLSLMWSMRFPGGYQGLASAVIGISLLFVLARVAASSGLLQRFRLPRQSDRGGGDGPLAGTLAAAVMLLVAITGVLVGMSAVLLAATGEQPAAEMLAAEIVAIGLGMVPLSLGAAVSARARGVVAGLSAGSLLIGVGTLLGLILWPLRGALADPLGGLAAGAEILIAAGIVLMATAVRRFAAAGQ
ncbi:MAG: hypothetical protein ACOX9R_00760 [Armatimonadota bacterium]